MKKRLTALLMAMTMVLALAACGAKNEGDPSVNDTQDQVQETLPESESPEQNPDTDATAQTSIDLNAFYESVLADNPDNWPAMMLAEGEVMESWFPGLDAVDTKQCYPYTPMMTGQAAELVLVEAADADAAAAVKDILQARIDYHTSGTAMLYPATEEVWKNNSRLVENGNFLMLVVHTSADDVVESFNALFA